MPSLRRAPSSFSPSTDVMAKPETVAADRRKIRDGLASLKEMDGLIGMVQRTPDGEAIKPYVYVNAVYGNWNILHTPIF